MIAELRDRKEKLKLTYDEIASKSGIPLSTIQKVLGGKVANPRAETIRAIEDVLSAFEAPKEISVGNQNFATIIENGYFYVDKTEFIRKWWKSADVVTLITRPRRFGKSL